MIPEQRHPHRAFIDTDGNIVISGTDDVPTVDHKLPYMQLNDFEEHEETMLDEPAWDIPKMQEYIIEEDSQVDDHEGISSDMTNMTQMRTRTKMYEILQDFVAEGIRQYEGSIAEGKRIGNDTADVTVSLLRRIWNFLSQPVWIPDRKKKPKQYSRGMLFIIDTVRFGGTFASIFVLLFVALNYESFWSIAQSFVDPLAKATMVADIVSTDETDMAAKLKRIPTLATAGQDGSMLDYLPQVGPPDHRIIIPKLNLNVPIVIPPNEALINEDWKTLEDNIQSALQDGVVHYPGTARPGQAGNFFITGHSSYFPWAKGNYKSVFARLAELKIGDEYWVFYGGDRYRYVIDSKKEIRPSDVSVLDQPINKRISTLMTCTPVGTTLRRLIITAQETDPITGSPLKVGEHRHPDTLPKIRTELLPI